MINVGYDEAKRTVRKVYGFNGARKILSAIEQAYDQTADFLEYECHPSNARLDVYEADDPMPARNVTIYLSDWETVTYVLGREEVQPTLDRIAPDTVHENTHLMHSEAMANSSRYHEMESYFGRLVCEGIAMYAETEATGDRFRGKWQIGSDRANQIIGDMLAGDNQSSFYQNEVVSDYPIGFYGYQAGYELVRDFSREHGNPAVSTLCNTPLVWFENFAQR